MSAAREAAARRARLRGLLGAKTQAEVAKTQAELLEQLGSSVSLRTLKRDLQKLRGSVPKGTQTKRAGGNNHSKVGSNMSMTKKVKQLEDRLAALEDVQLRVIDVLGKAMDFAAESRENEMKLLDITNRARDVQDADRNEFQQLRDAFMAEAGAAHYEHITNH